jgi:hypothetical protein
MTYELNVKSDYSRRCYTIRLKYTSGVEKYRTNRLPKDEFESMLNYTIEDWEKYLDTSNNYSLIK